MGSACRKGSVRHKRTNVWGVGRTVTSLVGAVMFSTMMSGNGAVAAEKSVTEQILDILKTEGKISEQKYQELSAKAREEMGKDTDFDVFWKDGLNFNSKDGNFKMQIGGRVQVDWASVNADDDLSEDLSGLDGDGTESPVCWWNHLRHG